MSGTVIVRDADNYRRVRMVNVYWSTSGCDSIDCTCAPFAPWSADAGAAYQEHDDDAFHCNARRCQAAWEVIG